MKFGQKALKLVAVGLIIFASTWLYFQSQWIAFPEMPEDPQLKFPVLKQQFADNPSFRPNVQAPVALAFAPTSKTILFEKNSEIPRAPASTTKLMTALVSLDIYSLNTLLTVDANDLTLAEKPVFQIGEELLVGDLLEAMLVSSSNQAAYILANHSPGGLPVFVKKMNQFAQDYGLASAHFSNPAGFDSPEQQINAKDLLKLAEIAMSKPTIKKIVALKQVKISDFNGDSSHNFQTTNHLLLEGAKVIGIKTGTTRQAGQVLISQFELDDEDLIVVVMGSNERYMDTKAIVNWVVESYDWLNVEELSELAQANLNK